MGLDGPVMYRDALNPSILHLYLLSYETAKPDRALCADALWALIQKKGAAFLRRLKVASTID